MQMASEQSRAAPRPAPAHPGAEEMREEPAALRRWIHRALVFATHDVAAVALARQPA